MTLTFAFSRAKTAPFVNSMACSMIKCCVVYIALTAWDLTMDLIGQIPQEANTVLHQLHEQKKMVRHTEIMMQCRFYSENWKNQFTLLSTSLRLICD